MPDQLTPTWRVTAYDPTTNTAHIQTFPTEQDARHYAGIFRNRHPTWDIDIKPIPTRQR